MGDEYLDRFLLKVAAETPDEEPQRPSFLRRHAPAIAGTAAAAIAAPLIYKYMRTQRFSDDPALRALQEKSKGLYTRILPGSAQSRSGVVRAVDKWLGAGGGNVHYQDDLQKKLEESGEKRLRFDGAVHHTSINGDKQFKGDLNLSGNRAARAIHRKVKNDKWREYELFNKTTPGAMGASENMQSVMDELGHSDLPSDPAERAGVLTQIQEHLRKKFPKGFLLKDNMSAETNGSFPTEKTDFAELHQQYANSGYNEERDKLMEGIKDLKGTAHLQAKKQIRADLQKKFEHLYAGRVFDKMQVDPSTAMVQEKLPLEAGGWFGRQYSKLTHQPATKEMRLHVVNGALVPSLTIPRYDPSMYVTGRGQMAGAEEYARKLMTDMPEKYRGSTFAMDIAPLQGGGYGLIESNPSGVSGFFNPKKMPIVGPLLHKAFTGRHSQGISGLGAATGAATAGLATAGAAHALTRPKRPEEQAQPGQGPMVPPQHAAMKQFGL